MEINRVGTGGIDNGDAANGTGKAQKPSVLAFNVEAQVIPSDIAAGQAGQARVFADTGLVEIKLVGLGSVSVTQDELGAFTKRLEAGMRAFENESIDHGITIGGANKESRFTAASLLLGLAL
ncbi:MAG: hypothetical protein O3C63_00635 [Cyanobacteria bacterium]|nr:hypothetical protein [Cyanobacteriota bacterium]